MVTDKGIQEPSRRAASLDRLRSATRYRMRGLPIGRPRRDVTMNIDGPLGWLRPLSSPPRLS